MMNYFRLSLCLVLFVPIINFSQLESWEEFEEVLTENNLKVKDVKKAIIKNQNDLTEEEKDDCFEFINDKNIYPKYKMYEYYICRKFDSGSVGWYHIKFYSYRKKVIKLVLTHPEYPNFKIKFTTSKFNELLNLHFNKMLIEPDTLHPKFIPEGRVIVSFGCFYGGSWFQEMKDIKKLVNDNDKEEILKWCTSLSPEIRAYGAIGLIWLFEKGIELSEKEKKILKYIYHEKSLITTCSGCTGYDVEKISDFLKYAVEEESTLKKLDLN